MNKIGDIDLRCGWTPQPGDIEITLKDISGVEKNIFPNKKKQKKSEKKKKDRSESDNVENIRLSVSLDSIQVKVLSSFHRRLLKFLTEPTCSALGINYWGTTKESSLEQE